MKTRQCISCKNLTDEPGQLLCPRCVIEHPSPPKKIKILLIDDEMEILKELKEKLESTLYFEVTTAYDGRKGLDKLEYEIPSPQLVIVDVNMPVINGHQFVEKLRKHQKEQVRKMPVIVLAEKKQMEKFFQPWDIQGFLTKPVDLKALFTAIKEVIVP